MPYQGAYPGQYAGFPSYGHGQQPLPQYQANGMQYPVQHQSAQPIPHQMHQAPMNGDIYSKQYYQQPQQQKSYPSQPAQYNPQYPVYQQSQNQRLQHSASFGGPAYAVCVRNLMLAVSQKGQANLRQTASSAADFHVSESFAGLATAIANAAGDWHLTICKLPEID